MTHDQLIALTEMASAALVAIERLDAGRPAEEIFAWLRDAVDEHKVVAFGASVLPSMRGET
jgi:aryl-alcohol dehydrogenase-like predicted oxidoreductase